MAVLGWGAWWQGEGFPAHQVTGLGGLQQPERDELERLDPAAGGYRAQGAGVGGGEAGSGSAYRLEVIEVLGDRVVGRPPCPGDRGDGGRVYGPQLKLYTPFVLRDFCLVAWLFTNRVRDVRHVRARRRRMARRVVIGDLRVQQIDRRDGRRSWTIVWPEGTEHAEADRFLRRHEGSGTQRTYAYVLVDHLRWLERDCLTLDTAFAVPRHADRWASRGGSVSARMGLQHCRLRRPA